MGPSSSGYSIHRRRRPVQVELVLRVQVVVLVVVVVVVKLVDTVHVQKTKRGSRRGVGALKSRK